jgi:hypothetical protein
MTDRQTPMTDGEMLPYPVAASTKIEAGKMVAINTSGYAVEASDATTVSVVLGKAEAVADNSSGSNGDIDVEVRRKKAFLWDNDGTSGSPLTIASVGNVCYVKDDMTVSGATGTAALTAGHVLKVETAGVWVEPDF